MKQLENKASSPWEIKETVLQKQAPTQWTELTEEQKKQQENQEKEEKKLTHHTYVLYLHPFGYHYMPGCPLDKRPPPEILYPLHLEAEGRAYKQSDVADMYKRQPILIFRMENRYEHQVYYRFSGVRG
jgi:hypothetical protein